MARAETFQFSRATATESDAHPPTWHVGRSAKERGVFGASLRIDMASITRRRSGLMVCSVMEMRLPRVRLLNLILQDRTPHPAPLVLQRSEAILDHERRYVGGVWPCERITTLLVAVSSTQTCPDEPAGLITQFRLLARARTGPAERSP